MRSLHSRDSHKTASTTVLKSKHSPTVVFVTPYYHHHTKELCRFYLAVFHGRSEKPTSVYSVKARSDAMAAAGRELVKGDESFKSNEARKAARKAEGKATTLKVGDVLSSSWGYEQTNIDYYQVVAMVGTASVSLRQIGKETVDTEYMQGKCVPAVDQFVGEAFTKRFRGDGVRISSCQWASKKEKVKSAEGIELGFKPDHWTAYA